MKLVLQSAKRSLWDILTGLLIGSVASAVAIDLLNSSHKRALLIALLFAVAEVVALLLSAWGGIASLLASVLCVSVFVFEPVGSLYIDSANDRHIVLRMLLAGVPVCLALSWCSVVSLRKRTFGRSIR